MPDGTWVVSAIASLAHALQIPELHAVKCLRESSIHVLVSGKGIFYVLEDVPVKVKLLSGIFSSS
jgi:hypothetical protein